MIFNRFTKQQSQIQQVCCQRMKEAMLETAKTRELDETEKRILVELDIILTQYRKILK